MEHIQQGFPHIDTKAASCVSHGGDGDDDDDGDEGGGCGWRGV